MATNKDRIENLEKEVSGLHDNFSKIELGVADKLQRIEDNIS